MFGPGAYLPDKIEGITSPNDLPQTKIEQRSRNYLDVDVLDVDTAHRVTPKHLASCTIWEILDLVDLSI
ncbi:MAG: hypothetical protein ACFCD0_17160 [Gemmataceae bacterium]